MIQIEAFGYLQGVLQVGTNHDGQHAVHFLNQVQITQYGLQPAFEEFQAALRGAVVMGMRQAVREEVPTSPEPVMVGNCKVCNEPTASDEPGTRVNGPFIYCRRDANRW